MCDEDVLHRFFFSLFFFLISSSFCPLTAYFYGWFIYVGHDWEC